MPAWFWVLVWPPTALVLGLIVGPLLRRHQPPASPAPATPEEGNR